MTGVGPPQLPGYDFEGDLGRGGFADVYLYRQHRPERQVAVKVLREATQSEADARRFENEINRMSKLSAHPGILTIYEVGVAPDQRPFFTMEYCPNDHFGQIARANPLSVAQALEVGIKVAGAVDTAHAAGILHRDIKPANILLTAYGEPALTDFGIAGGRDADASSEPEGVTIPFAPPEAVSGRSPGDELSDVYSLGATIYSLLAGRAPFSTGRPATQAEVIARINQGGPPPTGRQDVPAELERVLATAMAVDPAQRFPSAAAFGRALQTVETSLNLPQTALRVAPTGPVVRRSKDDDDSDSTRFRAPRRVDPNVRTYDPPTTARPPATPVPTPTPAAVTAATAPDLPVPETLEAPTQHRRAVPSPPQLPYQEPIETETTSRTALVVSVAAAMVLVLLIGFFIVRGSGGDDEAATTTSSTVDEDAFVFVSPPTAPTEVEVTSSAEGQPATVTWESDHEDGDRYRIEVTAGPMTGETFGTATNEFHFNEAMNELCVHVYAIRSSQVSEASREACLT